MPHVRPVNQAFDLYRLQDIYGNSRDTYPSMVI